MNDELVKKIRSAIWEELGGLEVSHPWMCGATDAVTARVMVILNEKEQVSCSSQLTSKPKPVVPQPKPATRTYITKGKQV